MYSELIIKVSSFVVGLTEKDAYTFAIGVVVLIMLFVFSLLFVPDPEREWSS